MKKLILAITLVVILTVSAIGTTVVAGSPPDNKPTEAWDLAVDAINDVLTRIGAFPTTNYVSIAAAVEDIRTKIMGVDSSLNTTDGKVEAIQASVDAVQTSVESLSASAIIMESDAGIFSATGADPDTVFNITHDQIAHVTLTVYGDWMTAGDSAWVSLMWEGGSYEPAIIVFDTGAGIYKGTVEFVAKEWALRCYDDDAWMDVHWAYTATYPANSTE